jgi:hypothetical protein
MIFLLTPGSLTLALAATGISSDTAEFAVERIRKWWYLMGKKLFLILQKYLLPLIVVEAMVSE